MKRLAILLLLLGFSTPALAVYHNTAGQKISIYAYDSGTTSPATYDAANILATISVDGATSVSLIDEHPAEIGSGIYVFDLATSETNASMIILYAASSTPGVVIEPVTVYTRLTAAEISAAILQTPGQKLYTDMSGRVDVGAIGGETVAVGTAPPTSATIATAVEPVIAARTLEPEDYATSSSIPVIDLSDVATSGALLALATQLTTPIAANVTHVNNTTVTLADPDDYKADVSGLATAANLAVAQADLDNPAQYKATGFSTHSAADVWAVAARALTDKAGFSLATAPPTAAQIKTEIEQAGSSLALILADTSEMQADDLPGALASLQSHGDSTWATANVSGLATTAQLNARTLPSDDYSTSSSIPIIDLSDVATSGAVAAVQVAVESVEGISPTSFTLLAKAAEITEIQGAAFTSASHSLAAIRARGDSAWVTGSSTGTGAITTTYTLKTAGGVVVPNIRITVTTDVAKTNTVATGTTNNYGQVVMQLDAGTYYVWRQDTARYSFTNPYTMTVEAD